MTRTIAVIITEVRMYEPQDQCLAYYLPSAVFSWGLGGRYLSLDNVTIMTMEIAIMIDTETNTAPHRNVIWNPILEKKSEKAKGEKLKADQTNQLWIWNMRKTKHYFINNQQLRYMFPSIQFRAINGRLHM